MQRFFTQILLVQCFLYGLTETVLAQGFPVAVVAVIDYAKILKNAEASKDVNLQIQKFRNKFTEEVRNEEIRLRAVEAKLKSERSRLSPDEFNKRRQIFRNQVLATQKRGQDRKRKLDRATEKAMRKIQKTVIKMVQEVTKTNGYTLVVEKSQVLFASRALEITDKILLKLNKNLRTVAIPKPK